MKQIPWRETNAVHTKDSSATKMNTSTNCESLGVSLWTVFINTAIRYNRSLVHTWGTDDAKEKEVVQWVRPVVARSYCNHSLTPPIAVIPNTPLYISLGIVWQLPNERYYHRVFWFCEWVSDWSQQRAQYVPVFCIVTECHHTDEKTLISPTNLNIVHIRPSLDKTPKHALLVRRKDVTALSLRKRSDE